MKRATPFLAALVLMTGGALSPAQSPARGGSLPSFEVVSIKRNTSRAGSSMSGYRPGGVYVATNVSLKFMIKEAYRLQDFQLQGGPNWIDSEMFDVQGRPEAAAAPAAGADLRDQLLLRLQSMLEDRFQLKIHRETKDLPVYELVVNKGGPKLTAAADQKVQCGGAGGPMCPGTRMQCCKDGMMDLAAVGTSVSSLAETIGQTVGRRVIDKTDLSGLFDFKLQWVRQDVTPTDSVSGPSIFTAVQEQLGLRLESTKGPVDVIVIDAVERPTEN